ncbi:undecaprenyl-phosphate glucose phosphotransferase [Synechococcus sp. CB0101]|uniref:undecaprenyl-phosphate glucose phosphotransferase n=1 Tax=Synechococcus sp. CB0101 TaxID=232348 RepID=UPI000682DCD4|nr:undecaprenyl-phosphate glucose phosphotransferase [Synechococcus sp. CB0101]QCH14403.1 undecaprenyl-phosphate glucose phosphotransferase [Synechococcus sp. CB0101]
MTSPQSPSRRRWGGWLRLYGDDLNRLQRLVDPLYVTLLFDGLVLTQLRPRSTAEEWLIAAVVATLAALILPQGKLYQSYRQQSLLTLMRRLSLSWLLLLAVLLALAFGTKVSAQFSRLAVMNWALLGWCGLFLLHVGGRKLLRWWRIRGGNTRSLVYWGTAASAVDFVRRLEQSPYLGLKVVAWFSPAPPPIEQRLPAGMPAWGGGLPQLRHWLDDHSADQIVFSHVTTDQCSMVDLLRFFGDTCIPVTYAPGWVMPGMRFAVEHVADQPCIDLWRPHHSGLDAGFKRLFDLAVAGFALTLLSPLLIGLALAIRCTSPGPVLFKQDRYGLDGRRFLIYKFRSMRVVEAGDQKGLRQATRNDPRITPLGAVMRRWSLDELPQLLNVLKGDMSVVGPRPHAVDHNEQYRQLIPGYMQRHLAKPGMTGLAQIRGFRGETATLEAMANRIAADLEYQRDWSLSTDLRILIQTVLHLKSSNAY